VGSGSGRQRDTRGHDVEGRRKPLTDIGALLILLSFSALRPLRDSAMSKTASRSDPKERTETHMLQHHHVG